MQLRLELALFGAECRRQLTLLGRLGSGFLEAVERQVAGAGGSAEGRGARLVEEVLEAAADIAKAFSRLLSLGGRIRGLFAGEEFFLQLLGFIELHALVAEFRLEAQGVGADLAGHELLAGRGSGDVVAVEELVARLFAA